MSAFETKFKTHNYRLTQLYHNQDDLKDLISIYTPNDLDLVLRTMSEKWNIPQVFLNCIKVLEETVEKNSKLKSKVVEAAKNAITLVSNPYALYQLYSILEIYDDKKDINYYTEAYEKFAGDNSTNDIYSLFSTIFFDLGANNLGILAYNRLIRNSLFRYDLYKQFKTLLSLKEENVWIVAIDDILVDASNVNGGKIATRLFEISKENASKLIGTWKEVIEYQSEALFEKLKELMLLAGSQELKLKRGDFGEILKGDLVIELLRFIIDRDKKYINTFLNHLFNISKQFYRRERAVIFSKVINNLNVDYFTSFLESKQLDEDSRRAYERLLYLVHEYIKNTGEEDILKKLKEAANRGFKISDDAEKKYRKQEKRKVTSERNKTTKTIAKQIELLKTSKIVNERLIYTYVVNPEWFSIPQKEIIKEQVEHFFKSKLYDPIKAKFNIKSKSENSTEYTTAQFIVNGTLSRCLKLAEILGIDIKKYRHRLLKYIPFVYDEDLNLIFQKLKVLGIKDKKVFNELLNSFSKDRDKIDDLRLFHPNNFIEVAKYYSEFISRYEFTAQVMQIIKDYMASDQLSEHHKELLIALLGEIGDNLALTYLKSVAKDLHSNYNYFNDVISEGSILTKEEQQNFRLFKGIQQILVKKFNDKDAINRLFSQLKEGEPNLSLPEYPEGEITFHGVTTLEEELDTIRDPEDSPKRLMSNIQYISLKKYDNKMRKLLERSFEIAKEPNLRRYAFALQLGIYSYYKKALSENGDYSPINNLTAMCDKYLLRNPLNEGVMHFKSNHIKNLQALFVKLNPTGKEKILIDLLDAKNAEIHELKTVLQNANFIIHLDTLKNRSTKILLVEGAHDKAHIEMAYSKLYPGEVFDYEIIPVHGVKSMDQYLNNIYGSIRSNQLLNHTIVGLYDFDGEGYRSFLAKNSELSVEPDQIKFKKLFYRQADNKRVNLLKLFLPIPRKLIGQVVIKPEEPIYSIRDTYGENSHCDVELLYYSDELLISNKEIFNSCFEEVPVPGGKVIKLKRDKKEFEKDISKAINELSREVFGSFKLLFEFLREI